MTDQPSPPIPQTAISLSPCYANTFHIIASPAIVRIAFGEAFGSPETAKFHVGVALTPDDARQLVRSLAGILGIALKEDS
jgi:hypothetical protein